jgi:tetratricopeptide (TPR) repeat protein
MARNAKTAASCLALPVAVSALALPAVGQVPDRFVPKSVEAREYAACMKLARNDPKAAHDSALAWRKKNGGDAAVHCIAVSLLGLGQSSQAARMLAELADQTDAKRPDLRAGLLGQAANAWIVADRPQTAEALLTDALALQPRDAEFLIDRSIARMAQGKTWEAMDDLNAALDRVPDRAEALTLRASAWRRLKTLDLAQKDIEKALSLKTDYPDALLERGLIRKARGDLGGARADWLKVLEIAATGPLTEAARRNLEIMDLRKN